jgi:1-aminocyclopropane-1-carboxylate deaminase
MSKLLSITEKIELPLFKQHNIHVQIKRDDLIHDEISGNKWRKLKYNLLNFKQKKYAGVVTFGGSFSNHIHAFAYACKQQNIPCVGVIRGEPQYANNFTLSWARHWGMHLHFVDRLTYRRRTEDNYLNELMHKFPNHLIIPEGGTNADAIKGVAEIISELKNQSSFDTLITPVGSGGTLAGLITGDSQQNKAPHKILGIAVLKQAEYLLTDVKQLLPDFAKGHNNWELLTQFHRGGYGKINNEDIERLKQINQQTGIVFEPVYSGKMMLALCELVEQGYFHANERIVLVHTGGLQGLGGMIEQGILSANDWPKPAGPP